MHAVDAMESWSVDPEGQILSLHFVAELLSSSDVPAGQAVHDVVVSVNDPAAQSLHSVADLLSSSYVPEAQAVHDVVLLVNDPALQTLQLSVAIDDVDASTLKVPDTQAVHLGSAVVDPAVLVYVPAAQGVWAVQISVATDDVDASTLNLPETQAVHCGSAVVDPAVSV